MSVDIGNFDKVKLLLRGDGLSGSTSVVDASLVPKTMTAVGNAVVSLTQSKFGGSSLAFDGTGDSISTPFSSDFAFGTGDFTLEAWVYIGGNSALPADNKRRAVLLSTFPKSGATTDGWSLSIDGNSTTTGVGILFDIFNASVESYAYATATSISQIVWHHIAVCRSGASLTLWLDGVAVSATMLNFSAGTVISALTPSILSIGGNDYTSVPHDLNGYMDEVRITKGLARYSETFTPPTTPFPGNGEALTSIGTLAASLTAYGGGMLTASLPMLTVYGGLVGSLNGAMVLPMLISAGSGGGRGAVTLPALSAEGTGHDASGEASGVVSLPQFSVLGLGGAFSEMTLPMLSVSATGTVINTGGAFLSLPQFSLNAFGQVSNMGQLSSLLPSFDAIGYSGSVLSVSIPGFLVQATGVSGTVGRAAVTLPMFELSASGYQPNHGSAFVSLPALRSVNSGSALLTLPGFTLTAVGHAVVTATYEAYAVNLQHNSDKANDEVTRYTNYPFNQVVRYQGHYYGVGPSGMFLLEGTVDVATPIPWTFKTTPNDLDSPMQKRSVSCYFGGRLGPAMTVTLYAGEKSGTAYAHSTPRGATAQNYRQTFGLGIKDRYYALGLSGTGTIELDDIEFNFPPLSRRI